MSAYDTSSPAETPGTLESRPTESERILVVPEKRSVFRAAVFWRRLQAWSGFLLFCTVLLMAYLVGTLVVAPMMVRAAGLRTTGFWAAPAIEPYVPRVRDPRVPETNLQIAPVKAQSAGPPKPLYTLGANGEVVEKPKKRRKRRHPKSSSTLVHTEQQVLPSAPKVESEEHYSGRGRGDSTGDGNGSGESGDGGGNL
jgi:hypothetical protein